MDCLIFKRNSYLVSGQFVHSAESPWLQSHSTRVPNPSLAGVNLGAALGDDLD